MAKRLTTRQKAKEDLKNEASVIKEKGFKTESPRFSNLSKLSKKTKLLLGFLIVVVFISILLYSFKGLFVAATVNNAPIYRLEVINELEKRAGNQTLDFLVTKKLIEQEAVKEGVIISDKEVEDEIKKIEDQVKQQGQKLEEATGMNRKQLAEQIRLKKMLDKMVGKDIKVTDEEINKYIEENKDFLPADIPEDELKKSIAERLRQQKLDQKLEDWIRDIKNKSKVNYFLSY